MKNFQLTKSIHFNKKLLKHLLRFDADEFKDVYEADYKPIYIYKGNIEKHDAFKLKTTDANISFSIEEPYKEIRTWNFKSVYDNTASILNDTLDIIYSYNQDNAKKLIEVLYDFTNEIYSDSLDSAKTMQFIADIQNTLETFCIKIEWKPGPRNVVYNETVGEHMKRISNYIKTIWGITKYDNTLYCNEIEQMLSRVEVTYIYATLQ